MSETMLKQKYKQTEVGLIPEDWQVVSLCEIFSFQRTSNFSKAQMSEDDEVGCIHYGLIHAIESTHYDLKGGTKYYVSQKQAKYDYVRNGDVIMVDASEDSEGINKSVEISGVNNKKYISGLHTYLLRDKNSQLADKFRGLILNSQNIKNQMLHLAVGMKVFGVSKTQLINVSLPIPPTRKEQRAIATALSDVDELLTSLEQLIFKKQAIKQGAMQELLTPPNQGGKRLSGFSGEWERIRVDEVITVARGGSPRPIQDFVSLSSNGLNWIKIGDTSSKSKYIVSSKEKIIPEGAQFSREVNVGDFILSNSMSFGRPYILKIDGCIHDGWLVLQNYQDAFDREFLYYTLMSKDVYNQYIMKASGSSVLNLNKEIVKTVELIRPTDIKEQKAIAQVLSDMDDEIKALEEKKDKYQKIKEGMMQELLTGKIRLV